MKKFIKNLNKFTLLMNFDFKNWNFRRKILISKIYFMGFDFRKKFFFATALPPFPQSISPRCSCLQDPEIWPVRAPSRPPRMHASGCAEHQISVVLGQLHFKFMPSPQGRSEKFRMGVHPCKILGYP